MVQVNETEVGGVRAFWAEGPSPPMVCLAFRVGRADEDLPRTGYAHIVEHLTLSSIHTEHPDANGSVTHNLVRFISSGTDLDAEAFLRDCCAALANLPTARLEAELRVLRTEASSRAASGPHGDSLLHLRYGARTFGLAGVEELALQRADSFEADLFRWKDEHFTRGNACIWSTAPLPETLDVELRDGPRVAPPAPVSVIRNLPAYLQLKPAHWVALDGVGERSSGLLMGASILGKRARARLRHDAGLTYQTGVLYDPLNATTAHAVVATDTLPEHASEVQRLLLGVVAELRTDGPTQEEMAEEVREYREAVAGPLAAPAALDAAAIRHLVTGERPDEDVAARLEATAPGDVARAIDDLMGTCLMLGPGRPAEIREMWEFQVEEPRPASGQVFKPVVPMPAEALVVGSSSVTMRGPESVTIAYEDIECLLLDPEGARQIWSRTGTRLRLRAADWKNGDRALAAIEEQVPENKRLRVRGSHVEAGPKPTSEQNSALVADVAPSRMRRAASAAIDLAILLGALWVALGEKFLIALARARLEYSGREVLLALAIPFAYDFVLTVATGRTIGKWVTGMRVVEYGPELPDAPKLLWRAVLKTAYFLHPLTFFMGIAVFFISHERQTWHDSGSKTFVVDEKWWRANAPPTESGAVSQSR